MTWQLSDPVTSDVYTLPIGPSALDNIDRQFNALFADQIEVGGATVLRRQIAVPTLTFTGTLIDETEYETLSAWAIKDYPVVLIDDRDVFNDVLITEWTPVRVRKGAPYVTWHHTWTLKVLVLDDNA